MIKKKKIIKIDRESIGKRAIEWRDRSSLKERRRRPVNQGKPWSIITCIATAVLAVSWSEPIRARTAYLLQRFRVSVILRVEPTIRLRAYWIILRAKRTLLFSLSLLLHNINIGGRFIINCRHRLTRKKKKKASNVEIIDNSSIFKRTNFPFLCFPLFFRGIERPWLNGEERGGGVCK